MQFLYFSWGPGTHIIFLKLALKTQGDYFWISLEKSKGTYFEENFEMSSSFKKIKKLSRNLYFLAELAHFPVVSCNHT